MMLFDETFFSIVTPTLSPASYLAGFCQAKKTCRIFAGKLPVWRSYLHFQAQALKWQVDGVGFVAQHNIFVCFLPLLRLVPDAWKSQTSAGVGLGHGSCGTDRSQDWGGGGSHDRWGQLGHEVPQGGERIFFFFALTLAGVLEGVWFMSAGFETKE